MTSYVSYFYDETKPFELTIEERSLGLSRIKRGRGVTRAVVLGKNCVVWLLAMVEEALNGEKLREFWVGSRAYIVQRQMNSYGQYMALAEYGGGQRGFIVVPEGQKGKGWTIFCCPVEKGGSVFSFSCSRWE